MQMRFQNGTLLEALTLSRTQQTLRIAVKGQDDVMELNNIHGTWVSEECEPVTVEMAMMSKTADADSEDDFICSQELACYLIRLISASDEDSTLGALSALKAPSTRISPMIA